MYPNKKNTRYQNHSYPIPINPGNHGLKTNSVVDNKTGSKTKIPKPDFMVKLERQSLANLPSGYFCTKWNTGTNNKEYKNKFHKNHRCPRAMILPKRGTQKTNDVKKIWRMNATIVSNALFPSKSTEPVKIPPRNPIVHIPKNIGTRRRWRRSVRKVPHVRRLKANAVPIPDIMNNAARRHWCIQ